MNKQDYLLERIHAIQDEKMTGFLELGKEDRHITVYFRKGLIDAAGSDIAQLQLGRILSGRGVLQTSVLPVLLGKARRRHSLLGKTAVAQKLLDNPELVEGVREQIVLTIMHALDNEFVIGPFKDSRVEFYMPARLDFDNLVLGLARNNIKPYPLDPSRLIGLNNGQKLSHLSWYPQELAVLNRLKTPSTLQELASSTGLEYARLGKILSVFDTLNLINQVDGAPSESTAIVKWEGFPFEYMTPEIGTTELSEKVETFHNPSSFISEQFKTLKVRIYEAGEKAPLQAIAVSSPQAMDGKSLVAANFAASFLKDPGKRVILVDCDLRNPSIHKFFGASIEPGLLGYLGNGGLPAYCYLRRIERLYLMTAGGVSANATENLSSGRMRELIAYLKTEFDLVILDCPPFGPISDAEILTNLADGLLMVVRSGRTTYSSMEKALKNLDGSKLVGMVFNDIKPMMFNTRYHYKYYHYKYRNSYPYDSGKPAGRRSKTYLE
jgi:capsular exopolysaccharide synthesis family protein